MTAFDTDEFCFEADWIDAAQGQITDQVQQFMSHRLVFETQRQSEVIVRQTDYIVLQTQGLVIFKSAERSG